MPTVSDPPVRDDPCQRILAECSSYPTDISDSRYVDNDVLENAGILKLFFAVQQVY